MKESPGDFELLSSRVDDLEKRVHALEYPEKSRSSATLEPRAKVTLDASDTTSALETGNLFPILGRAMLGVAGAYLLRAIAETNAVPRLPVSAFAVLYAFGWLLWSSRGRGNVAKAVYAATSALILSPLLWENTLRFHVFPPVICAGALAALLTLATLLGIRNGTWRAMWPAQTVAVITTVALAFTTHDVLPFITTLLIATLVSEYARIQQYPQPLWPLMVLVTDIAIWGLIFIYSGSQDTRAAYPDLRAVALTTPACLLFAINGSAVAVRVLAHNSQISIFEAIQVVIAFLLTVTGVLTFAPSNGAVPLGIVSLMLAACGYAATFRYLRGRGERRNLLVFGTWSAVLLLAGLLWALPGAGAAAALALTALAASYLAPRVEPGMLDFHAALFLLAAVVTSRLPRYVFCAIAGTSPQRLAPSMVTVFVCTAFAFVVAGPGAKGTLPKAVHFIPTLVAVCALVALLVHGALSGAAAFLVLEVHHVAFLRTFTICIAALAMAFGGSRWQRAELTHMAYIALAFVAAKLLFEDLRHGHMEFIAGSIALFAIALIAAPRLVRFGARLRAGVCAQESPLHIHN